jgi:hypothetical protein
MPNKFISDFDAERLVMEMVYDYELSIREARLEEIKGWRKALALGVAGLAGLAPMKAAAHGSGFWGPEIQKVMTSPSGGSEQDWKHLLNQFWGRLPAKVQQEIAQDQKDWVGWKNKLPAEQRLDATKERATFVGTLADLSQFVANPKAELPSGTTLEDVLARIKDGWASYTSFERQVLQPKLQQVQSRPQQTAASSTELDPDIMSKGEAAGKAYPLAPGVQLSPEEIRDTAATQAYHNGYTTEGQAQNSFIEGWIEGYYEGHVVPGNPERSPAQPSAQPTPTAPDIETQIKDLRAQIVAKWQKLPADIKTQIKAAPDLQNYENAFNQAPHGSAAKLKALQKVSDYLDSQTSPEGALDLTDTPAPTPTSQSQPTQVSPSQQSAGETATDKQIDVAMDKGQDAGKASPKIRSRDKRVSAATAAARKAGYTTSGQVQNAFIEAWFNGYEDAHGGPE